VELTQSNATLTSFGSEQVRRRAQSLTRSKLLKNCSPRIFFSFRCLFFKFLVLALPG